ncbi:TIGR00375 family protein [Methanothermobacter sp.]|uniref:TIGR00375 family protein n=1 Tax=Methanothermobacter sp. TaxID=1884223 RepID=UPI0026125208|nr:TIGR00375 family protein [Methanothermobacter sp.]MDI9618604.1 TIGR00375 family protein [Methanothermobacter sp.]
MILNADLHIHSCFSRATSRNMVIEAIAPQAKLKGLHIVGTGDAFHPGWRKIIEESTEYAGDGVYLRDECSFIITAEVEDSRRIHHLIILPSLEAAEEMGERMPSTGSSDGRPRVRMNGAQILEMVHEYDGIAGPAHAFTPWTSMYKSYDSYMDCYGKRPDFLELGLSADTEMADKISELADIPFLTNSDAHSPWPHRLGREFNQFEMDDISFTSLKRSIRKCRIRANYGLDPRLGKYHMTACTRCYRIYSPEEALQMKMKCPCGGRIKKGVDYRIYELSTWDEPHHPPHRPPYVHIMPLAEIIGMKYGKGVTTKFVQGIWEGLVGEFGTEIDVLLSVPIEDIGRIDASVAVAVEAFRNGSLTVIPGGGGKYGEIRFPAETLDAYFR